MKREIKFRAWNTQFKEMVYQGDKWVATLSAFAKAWENEPIMQYTGLKDSKGVEIYEGDIFDKGIVVFSNGCFNGCYTCGTTSKKGWDYSDEWEDGLAEYARKNKVIGNIYQNPELINI